MICYLAFGVALDRDFFFMHLALSPVVCFRLKVIMDNIIRTTRSLAQKNNFQCRFWDDATRSNWNSIRENRVEKLSKKYSNIILLLVVLWLLMENANKNDNFWRSKQGRKIVAISSWRKSENFGCWNCKFSGRHRSLRPWEYEAKKRA